MLGIALIALGYAKPCLLPMSQPALRSAPLLMSEPPSQSFPQTVGEWKDWVLRAKSDPNAVLQLVKDAGVAGAISYTVVELSFFAIALPIGYFAWHASTGEWLQPILLLREDGCACRARRLATLSSY